MQAKSIQVLIITEDKPYQQALIAMLAEARDVSFEPVFCRNAREAADASRKVETGVLLWDLPISKAGDLDQVSKLAAEIPGTPIFLLTSLKNEDLALEAVRKGAQDYLIKTDLNTRMLSRVIRYAMGRKEAAETVLETRRQMERLLAAIPSILIGLDAKDEVIHWSSGAEKVFGVPLTQVAGKHLGDCPMKWDAKKIQDGVAECRKSGHPVRVEDVTLKADDRESILGFTILPLKTEGRDDLILFGADVTEKKRLERMKEDFVSTVSHELRTPLLMIREGVALAVDGLLGPVTAEQKQFLTISIDSIDRLARIINDLLDMSKLEAGKALLNKEKTDLVALVRKIETGFAAVLKDSPVRLKTRFSSDKIEAEVDPDKMTQIFMNLVQNAVKFTEQGSIEVGVDDSGTEILCSVSDTGRGISREDMQLVFSKFQQFGRTHGPGEKGTGLGLSICKGLVELHGGSIKVESSLGKGTTFRFALPKK